MSIAYYADITWGRHKFISNQDHDLYAKTMCGLSTSHFTSLRLTLLSIKQRLFTVKIVK